jgi:ABC-type microcin C transport system permease subunit YejE
MPVLDLFWSVLYIFLLFAWIWLVISVYVDIFRRPDLSGWGKAGWALSSSSCRGSAC